MQKRGKRAAVELSISFLIVVVIAVSFLALGIGFIRNILSESTAAFEKKFSSEPDPPVPSASNQITFSRGTYRPEDNDVLLKFSIYNPTDADWTLKEALTEEDASCGNSNDRICYVDYNDGTGVCNTLANAITNDEDCTGEPSCDPDGICLIDNTPDTGCEGDPDCAPDAGADIAIGCTQLDTLALFTQRTILKGTYETFNAMVRLIDPEPDILYICSVSVKSETTYSKEFTVQT